MSIIIIINNNQNRLLFILFKKLFTKVFSYIFLQYFLDYLEPSLEQSCVIFKNLLKFILIDSNMFYKYYIIFN